jgi:hypothetical protein
MHGAGGSSGGSFLTGICGTKGLPVIEETPMQVVVITHCKDASVLYGNTLIFKTIRTGFPTADVAVIDNASLPEVRPLIREQAEKAECGFFQEDHQAPHYERLESIILWGRERQEPLIICDPDVVFWERCEDWDFGDHLLAGRLIPKFLCEVCNCITYPRLHTSFLWIPKPDVLANKIVQTASRYVESNLVMPYMFRGEDGIWYRYDTLASLYSVFKDETYHFGERELNSFDHLLLGCHVDAIASHLNEAFRKTLMGHHALAKSDYRKLKGIWRVQEDYFRDRSCE